MRDPFQAKDELQTKVALPALAFEHLPREQVMVSYAGSRPASQDDWDRYIEQMATVIGPGVRFLVYQDGAPPSLRDQQRIGALARPHRPRVALISSSHALRFVVSAFSLIVNKQIRFFGPEQLHDALRHLELGEREQRTVRDAIDRLKAQVERAT